MKVDLPNSKISDYLRYWELFLLGDSRTQEEQAEFEALQSTLADNIVSAGDINSITSDINDLSLGLVNTNSMIGNLEIFLYMEV